MEQFRHIDRVGIIFLCTKDDREEDDWTDEDYSHIVIRLLYKAVKQTADARPMMLARVKERLGLVAQLIMLLKCNANIQHGKRKHKQD